MRRYSVERDLLKNKQGEIGNTTGVALEEVFSKENTDAIADKFGFHSDFPLLPRLNEAAGSYFFHKRADPNHLRPSEQKQYLTTLSERAEAFMDCLKEMDLQALWLISHQNVIQHDSGWKNQIERTLKKLHLAARLALEQLPSDQGGVRPDLARMIYIRDLAIIYRDAELEPCHRAMRDFAAKLTGHSHESGEADRQKLRDVGFSEPDIRDLAAVAALLNMISRMAR